MQRLISLGLLVVLVGGGWSFIKGAIPPNVRQMAQVVGGVQLPGGSYQPATSQGGYSQPSYTQPSYTQPSYAPAVQPTSQATARSTIRIASFNIQVFGDAKARKPYVMNTLAAIIRNFDIVAIQEIRTQDDYFIQNFLRQYVNSDGYSAYDARVSERLGRTVSTEQYAYIYNTKTINVHPQVAFVMQDNADMLHREPYVAMFQCRGAPADQAFTFLLMNVHIDPDETDQELDALYSAYQVVQRMPIGGITEDDVILLGDFNTNVPSTGPRTQGGRGRALIPADLRMLSRTPGIYPLIRNQATNTRGTRIHDNLLISRIATAEFQGRSGVFDIGAQYGLSKEQVLEVSDHLPVWGEFSIYESNTLGRVAVSR